MKHRDPWRLATGGDPWTLANDREVFVPIDEAATMAIRIRRKCFNLYLYIPFLALGSLIRCVIRWIPLLELFGGGMGKVRKNSIF